MYKIKYEYKTEDRDWTKDYEYVEDPEQWVKELDDSTKYHIISITPVVSRKPSVAKLYHLLDDKKIDPT